MIYLLALGIGWLLGGVANWAADHLPYGRPTCRDIQLPATFPHYWTLWWYGWNNGICPHCKQRVARRSPLLESSIIASCVVTAYLGVEQLPTLLVGWVYTAFLLTVLIIDLEHRRVLNNMLGPASAIVLILSLRPGSPNLLTTVLGGLAGFGTFCLLAWIGRGALGAGDVKLAGLIGLMTGYPNVWQALALGILLGGVGALFLLLIRRVTRKSSMPYAPYLVIGALVILWNR